MNRHDQRNKNVCDLREGISTTFKIFLGLPVLKGYRPTRNLTIYTPFDTPRNKEQEIYGLGVEISTIVGYLGTS